MTCEFASSILRAHHSGLERDVSFEEQPPVDVPLARRRARLDVRTAANRCLDPRSASRAGRESDTRRSLPARGRSLPRSRFPADSPATSRGSDSSVSGMCRLRQSSKRVAFEERAATGCRSTVFREAAADGLRRRHRGAHGSGADSSQRHRIDHNGRRRLDLRGAPEILRRTARCVGPAAPRTPAGPRPPRHRAAIWRACSKRARTPVRADGAEASSVERVVRGRP